MCHRHRILCQNHQSGISRLLRTDHTHIRIRIPNDKNNIVYEQDRNIYSQIHRKLLFGLFVCRERLQSHTVRSYANALSSYIDFIETTQHIRSERITTAYVTKKLVLEYLSWLEDKKNVSVSTRNQRLAAIHSLCRYLQRVDVPHIDRWQDVLTIKTKKGTAKPMLFLSVDGIRLLLNQIPTDTISHRRDLAMLALLYDTGARVNELVLLRPCDLHLEEPAYLVLQGKGNKNRAVPLQKKNVALLTEYLNDNLLHRPEMQTEPLFKNRVGGRLTCAGVTYILMKYIRKAHSANPDLVPVKLSPHCLRHTRAMHLLQAGVNLVYIRDILGHVSILTTEIYARADSRQKREALEKAYRDVIPETSDDGSRPSWETDRNLKEWLKRLGSRNH